VSPRYLNLAIKVYICFLGSLHVSSNIFLTALASAPCVPTCLWPNYRVQLLDCHYPKRYVSLWIQTLAFSHQRTHFSSEGLNKKLQMWTYFRVTKNQNIFVVKNQKRNAKTKPMSGCADITVPDTRFIFSISFLVFNSENISIFYLDLVLPLFYVIWNMFIILLFYFFNPHECWFKLDNTYTMIWTLKPNPSL
jgi:hypothetical protein